MQQSANELPMPGLVAVWQPAFGNYRIFMTGGQHNPSQWIFGRYGGQSSMDTLPKHAKKLNAGVYSL